MLKLLKTYLLLLKNTKAHYIIDIHMYVVNIFTDGDILTITLFIYPIRLSHWNILIVVSEQSICYRCSFFDTDWSVCEQVCTKVEKHFDLDLLDHIEQMLADLGSGMCIYL